MKKQLRKYIAPNILAMVGTSCYVLADTFFISIAAGANGITALNLVLPIYGLIFALGSMIGVALPLGIPCTAPWETRMHGTIFQTPSGLRCWSAAFSWLRESGFQTGCSPCWALMRKSCKLA